MATGVRLLQRVRRVAKRAQWRTLATARKQHYEARSGLNEASNSNAYKVASNYRR